MIYPILFLFSIAATGYYFYPKTLKKDSFQITPLKIYDFTFNKECLKTVVTVHFIKTLCNFYNRKHRKVGTKKEIVNSCLEDYDHIKDELLKIDKKIENPFNYYHGQVILAHLNHMENDLSIYLDVENPTEHLSHAATILLISDLLEKFLSQLKNFAYNMQLPPMCAVKKGKLEYMEFFDGLRHRREIDTTRRYLLREDLFEDWPVYVSLTDILYFAKKFDFFQGLGDYYEYPCEVSEKDIYYNYRFVKFLKKRGYMRKEDKEVSYKDIPLDIKREISNIIFERGNFSDCLNFALCCKENKLLFDENLKKDIEKVCLEKDEMLSSAIQFLNSSLKMRRCHSDENVIFEAVSKNLYFGNFTKELSQMTRFFDTYGVIGIYKMDRMIKNISTHKDINKFLKHHENPKAFFKDLITYSIIKRGLEIFEDVKNDMIVCPLLISVKRIAECDIEKALNQRKDINPDKRFFIAFCGKMIYVCLNDLLSSKTFREKCLDYCNRDMIVFSKLLPQGHKFYGKNKLEDFY